MSLIVTAPVEPDRLYTRRWAALGVLCSSLLIVVMANSSLIVAAPDMTMDLGLTSQDLQWVIDAYTIPYAALMLILGAIGDKYSRRGILLLGLIVFAGGAILGSTADSVGLVITVRAVMGVAAAMIMPATLSLLVATFPKRERAVLLRFGPPRPAWPSPAGPCSRAGCWPITPGDRPS
ncbi:MFS transporter [Nocardia asteroides]|uniref:MFS transporter n=1 Tax=Nocardia asteroides TaxID=1824 RepID=UPI0037C999C7